MREARGARNHDKRAVGCTPEAAASPTVETRLVSMLVLKSTSGFSDFLKRFIARTTLPRTIHLARGCLPAVSLPSVRDVPSSCGGARARCAVRRAGAAAEVPFSMRARPRRG